MKILRMDESEHLSLRNTIMSAVASGESTEYGILAYVAAWEGSIPKQVVKDEIHHMMLDGVLTRYGGGPYKTTANQNDRALYGDPSRKLPLKPWVYPAIAALAFLAGSAALYLLYSRF